MLRIPRSDEAGSFILARVTPSGPASRPLDARLAATEGVAPYVLTCKCFQRVCLWKGGGTYTSCYTLVRHDRIDRLRSQNAPCSAEEWKGILAFLLLGQGAAENIDATATVQEESALTITVRKRVENITVCACTRTMLLHSYAHTVYSNASGRYPWRTMPTRASSCLSGAARWSNAACRP